MRAAIRTSRGIQYAADVCKPSPSKGQVLIRVMAAGINPADYKLPRMIAGKVVGLDVAGVVEEVGPGVASFAQGDEVFGFAGFGNGGVADFALADVGKITAKPAAFGWIEAGCLPTAYLTSYQCLVEHGGLQAGHRVLILGASGGCGTAGVQLASAMGASEVVAVCSAANAELVLSLGATRCVDYKDADALRALCGETGAYDVVYDCATGSGKGEDYRAAAAAVLRPGRVTVAINGGLSSWLRLAFGLQPRSRRLMLTRQNGAQLAEIVKLLGGAPAPIIDSTPALSAEGVQAAFARLASRRARGKIVFDVAATQTAAATAAAGGGEGGPS